MRMKKTSRKQLRILRRRRLALALVGAMAMPMMPAMAQNIPSAGTVVNGTATIGQNGNEMTITQTTKGAIIDWGSFSIGTGYGVTFDQQFGSSSVTLNRVVSAMGPGYAVPASQINGTLTSNGNVFIINPAGITFGSGAQVNVGGLIASTMNITNADFLAGVTSGRFVFQPPTTPGADVNGVSNEGRIDTTAGGTVGFIGSTLYNTGDITAPGGSVVFGSGNQVTLDFFGDGLTQVTVTGPGLFNSEIACPSFPCGANGIAGNSGTIIADGGQILMRVAAVTGNTQPAIWNTGILRAQSLVNRAGRVELTAPDGAIFMGNLVGDDRQGIIDVSGGAFIGGTALLQGGAITLGGDANNANNSSFIEASGDAGGGQVDLISTAGILLFNNTAIRANGLASGNGGTVRLQAAGNIFSLGDLGASGGVISGDGGLIDLQSTAGAAVATNVYADGGTGGDGGSIALTSSSGGVGIVGTGSASGGVNGGSIRLLGADVIIAETTTLHADGASGSGGSIALAADDTLTAFGLLSARGGAAGGSILTSSGGTFDIRGLQVDAGSAGSAGTWTLEAPDLTITNGNDLGTLDSRVLGNDVQDAEINNAFATGTTVVLQSADDVVFDDAQIVADNALPLSFIVNAEGGIFGNAFSITSVNGPLDMLFNANASGGNLENGGIDFSDATLSSYGGDILMYGQSDRDAGYASATDNGILLDTVVITTGGGDVLLRGSSTGVRGAPGNAGVNLIDTDIDSAAGNLLVSGIGAFGTHGVFADSSTFTTGAGNLSILGVASGTGDGVNLYYIDIDAGIGDVTIDGQSVDGDGLYAYGSNVVTAGGNIALTGIGGAQGVDFDGDSNQLYSYGGDILVRGEGGTGAGVYFSGQVNSDGGDITMYGLSAAATGLDFGGGYYSGMISNGGDIVLTGIGATLGVQLRLSTFIDNEIYSAGGAITVTGNASAPDGIGVYSEGVDLIGGAGDVTVTGIAPLGIGILFGDGAGVSTTTGAIGLYGTGADFGLDIADGALDTDSGDITLEGTATATTATAGVRVAGDGLVTNGGDITVTGTSAGGVGVQLGDGSAFAIGSGGGAITIEGLGIDAGVLMQGNQVASGEGAVSITGTGANVGVALDGSEIDSAGGAIDIEGSATGTGATGVSLYAAQLIGGAGDVTVTGSAVAGIGIALANGSSVSTTTGAIGLYGTGADFGLDITDGALDTDSGDITLDGTATATTATAGVRVTGDGLVTNGGDITVTGTSAGGVGVQLGDGSAFAIGSGGGAITIEGVGIDAGVLMQGNQVASGGGAVSITGTGTAMGVSLDGSDIDSAGGNIDVQGEASGSGTGVDLTNARLTAGAGDIRVFGGAELGTGVRFAGQSGVSTTTGDIGITGIGASIGLDIGGGEFATDSGHIDLRGRGVAPGSIGLRIGQGVVIATDGGGIELSGEGNAAAGLVIGDGASVDAGDSLIVLRATSTSATDTIDIRGSISSGVGVNLRPGGVDLQGGLTEATADNIYLGSGSGGFVLSDAELALIDTPELIIGSNLHAGAIQVLGGINREGNLTLQNDGGSGGIVLQAGLDVGDGTLALSSGGSITQTSAGVINAHSLLAQAAGDVLLAAALNDVANTTLAGSAGGDFEFQDANTLAIGSVSAIGFDASSGQLSSFGATGITAGGDAFVRNLQGDLTLNAGVTATNIDLVTAGRLQNVVGASLVASGDWRVWASTWEGETRGGLAGDGSLPNLYGCAYLGACGVTVTSGDNHFIYVQQPIATITFDNATREYGLPNPLFTFSVAGAILGDTAANVAAGSASTTATIGSDVGLYPILGNFTSAAGYQIQFVPGTLAITPATLLFTADGAIRYLGFPNPDFTGTVSGFRNGDTVASVFGNTVIWSSPAGPLSPVGFYPVNGGTSARNYVFAQAPGNATALQVIPLPSVPGRPVNFIRETINTYVYDRNFGGAPVCAVNASIDDTGLASSGDGLSTEWTKVRSRPNLTNCFDSERENGCGNF